MNGYQPALTQTAGIISGNVAQTFGGGISGQGAAMMLLGGSVTSNTAPFGAGIYALSNNGYGISGQVVVSGGLIARNAGASSSQGGGVDLLGFSQLPMYFTQTAGSVESNTSVEGGGVSGQRPGLA